MDRARRSHRQLEALIAKLEDRMATLEQRESELQYDLNTNSLPYLSTSDDQSSSDKLPQRPTQRPRTNPERGTYQRTPQSRNFIDLLEDEIRRFQLEKQEADIKWQKRQKELFTQLQSIRSDFMPEPESSRSVDSIQSADIENIQRLNRLAEEVSQKKRKVAELERQLEEKAKQTQPSSSDQGVMQKAPGQALRPRLSSTSLAQLHRIMRELENFICAIEEEDFVGTDRARPEGSVAAPSSMGGDDVTQDMIRVQQKEIENLKDQLALVTDNYVAAKQESDNMRKELNELKRVVLGVGDEPKVVTFDEAPTEVGSEPPPSLPSSEIQELTEEVGGTEEEAVSAEEEVIPTEDEVSISGEEAAPTEEEAVAVCKEEAVCECPSDRKIKKQQGAPYGEEAALVGEETAPAEEGTVPPEEEAVPSEEEAIPPLVEEAVAIADEAYPGGEEAAEEEAAPTEEEAILAEEEAASTEEEAVLVEEEAAPIEEEATPTEEEAILAEEEAAPIEEEEEAVPAEEEAAPTEEEKAPAEDEVSTRGEEAVPTEEEAVSAEEEAVPAEEEAVPFKRPICKCPTGRRIKKKRGAPYGEEAALVEETAPAEEGTVPPDEEAVPSEEEAVPSEAVALVEEAVAQVEDEAYPGGEEAAPTEDEVSTGGEEAVPTEEEATPTEEEAAPVEEEVAPVEEEAYLGGEEAASTEEEPVPTEEEAVPAEEEAAPTEEEKAPAEDEVSTGGEKAVPTEEEAVSAEEEAVPAEEEAVPAKRPICKCPSERIKKKRGATYGEEAALVDEETAPTEEGTVPPEEAVLVEEEVAPVEEEAYPGGEEAAPTEEEAVLTEEEAIPAEEEAAPTEEEAAPVEEEVAPDEEEAYLGGEEAAPTEEEPFPTEEEAAPVEEEAAPGGEEATPSEEGAASPEEPVVISEEGPEDEDEDEDLVFTDVSKECCCPEGQCACCVLENLESCKLSPERRECIITSDAEAPEAYGPSEPIIIEEDQPPTLDEEEPTEEPEQVVLKCGCIQLKPCVVQPGAGDRPVPEEVKEDTMEPAVQEPSKPGASEETVEQRRVSDVAGASKLSDEASKLLIAEMLLDIAARVTAEHPLDNAEDLTRALEAELEGKEYCLTNEDVQKILEEIIDSYAEYPPEKEVLAAEIKKITEDVLQSDAEPSDEKERVAEDIQIILEGLIRSYSVCPPMVEGVPEEAKPEVPLKVIQAPKPVFKASSSKEAYSLRSSASDLGCQVLCWDESAFEPVTRLTSSSSDLSCKVLCWKGEVQDEGAGVREAKSEPVKVDKDQPLESEESAGISDLPMDSEDKTEPLEEVDTSQTVDSEDQAEPIKEADVDQTVDSEDKAEPVEEADTDQTVDSEDKAEPIEELDADQLIESEDKTEPVEEVDEDKPVDSEDKTEPVDEVDADQTVDSEDKTEPVEEADKDQPVDSEDKTEPVEEADKDQPVDSEDKTEPVEEADKEDKTEPVEEADKDQPVESEEKTEPIEEVLLEAEETAPVNEFNVPPDSECLCQEPDEDSVDKTEPIDEADKDQPVESEVKTEPVEEIPLAAEKTAPVNEFNVPPDSECSCPELDEDSEDKTEPVKEQRKQSAESPASDVVYGKPTEGDKSEDLKGETDLHRVERVSSSTTQIADEFPLEKQQAYRIEKITSSLEACAFEFGSFRGGGNVSRIDYTEDTMREVKISGEVSSVSPEGGADEMEERQDGCEEGSPAAPDVTAEDAEETEDGSEQVSPIDHEGSVDDMKETEDGGEEVSPIIPESGTDETKETEGVCEEVVIAPESGIDELKEAPETGGEQEIPEQNIVDENTVNIQEQISEPVSQKDCGCLTTTEEWKSMGDEIVEKPETTDEVIVDEKADGGIEEKSEYIGKENCICSDSVEELYKKGSEFIEETLTTTSSPDDAVISECGIEDMDLEGKESKVVEIDKGIESEALTTAFVEEEPMVQLGDSVEVMVVNHVDGEDEFIKADSEKLDETEVSYDGDTESEANDIDQSEDAQPKIEATEDFETVFKKDGVEDIDMIGESSDVCSTDYSPTSVEDDDSEYDTALSCPDHDELFTEESYLSDTEPNPKDEYEHIEIDEEGKPYAWKKGSYHPENFEGEIHETTSEDSAACASIDSVLEADDEGQETANEVDQQVMFNYEGVRDILVGEVISKVSKGSVFIPATPSKVQHNPISQQIQPQDNQDQGEPTVKKSISRDSKKRPSSGASKERVRESSTDRKRRWSKVKEDDSDLQVQIKELNKRMAVKSKMLLDMEAKLNALKGGTPKGEQKLPLTKSAMGVVLGAIRDGIGALSCRCFMAASPPPQPPCAACSTEPVGICQTCPSAPYPPPPQGVPPAYPCQIKCPFQTPPMPCNEWLLQRPPCSHPPGPGEVVARRVDHDSLLLRWSSTKNPAVTGFDIYVNGCVVQRVRGHRSNAILTGLNLCCRTVICVYAMTRCGTYGNPMSTVYQPPICCE